MVIDGAVPPGLPSTLSRYLDLFQNNELHPALSASDSGNASTVCINITVQQVTICQDRDSCCCLDDRSFADHSTCHTWLFTLPCNRFKWRSLLGRVQPSSPLPIFQ